MKRIIFLLLILPGLNLFGQTGQYIAQQTLDALTNLKTIEFTRTYQLMTEFENTESDQTEFIRIQVVPEDPYLGGYFNMISFEKQPSRKYEHQNIYNGINWIYLKPFMNQATYTSDTNFIRGIGNPTIPWVTYKSIFQYVMLQDLPVEVIGETLIGGRIVYHIRMKSENVRIMYNLTYEKEGMKVQYDCWIDQETMLPIKFAQTELLPNGRQQKFIVEYKDIKVNPVAKFDFITLEELPKGTQIIDREKQYGK